MNISLTKNCALLLISAGLIAACSGSNNNPAPSPPPPPAPPPPATSISITGNVLDGPVLGGSLYAFRATDVNAAIDSADAAGDRAAALAAAGPIAELTRDPADGDVYTMTVPGDLANEAIFFVFDSENAEDEEFGDQPFNLEAVMVAGDANTALRVNLTPHTTMTSIQVRAGLDPDGDGTVITAAEITAARDVANGNTMAGFGTSSLGNELFPGSEDPRTTEDLDLLESASSDLGFAVRGAAVIAGVSSDEVVYLLAADVADGVVDGVAPVSFALDQDQQDDLGSIVAANALGAPQVGDMAASSCSASANSLRRACEFEVLDEFFIGTAICAHSETEGVAATCLEATKKIAMTHLRSVERSQRRAWICVR